MQEEIIVPTDHVFRFYLYYMDNRSSNIFSCFSEITSVFLTFARKTVLLHKNEITSCK